MLHAGFTPIALCFVYTSWHFYAFSGTNLLTRCHSIIPIFCCFCVSEKLHRKYSWNWTKRKPKFLFTWHKDGVQRRDGGEPGGGRTIGWRGPPPGRTTRWCGPLVHPLTSPFRLYILSEAKTLNQSASIHEKFCSAAAIEDQFWGTEVSVPAPCREGELPPEPSPLTPPLSPSPLLSPMMRRE
jgi:hypothetical protein